MRAGNSHRSNVQRSLRALPRPQRTPAAPAPASPGRARSPRSASNPHPASRVLLDGKLLGVTPLMDLSIESGMHEVVFIHGVETREKTIRVDPGQAGRVHVTF